MNGRSLDRGMKERWATEMPLPVQSEALKSSTSRPHLAADRSFASAEGPFEAWSSKANAAHGLPPAGVALLDTFEKVLFALLPSDGRMRLRMVPATRPKIAIWEIVSRAGNRSPLSRR